MIKDYQEVQIIDLLQDKRQREERLTKEYYRLFFDSEFRRNDQLKFLHFDFHSFCKGDKFQALRVLIGQLGDSIQKYGQFIQELSSGEILGR